MQKKTYVTIVDDHTAVIRVPGKFTFLEQPDIEEQFNNCHTQNGVDSVEVDLSGTDYMDSVAIQVLTRIYRTVGPEHFCLRNVSGKVKSFLISSGHYEDWVKG